MELKKFLNKIIPPCRKCPYTLGRVKFVVNPCPECRANNYNMYYMLTEGKPKPTESTKVH